MKRLSVAIIALCACSFSEFAAAYLPWQHGTYRGEPTGPEARLAYSIGAPGMMAPSSVPRARPAVKAAPAENEPVCYRFKFDEELQFIRCY
jgi:hypothetical protein